MESIPRMLYQRAASYFICRSCARRLYSRTVSNQSQARGRPRYFHSNSSRRDEDEYQPTQAQPLSGYYADLLSQPIPRPLPTSTPASTKKANEERARVVFGTRLAGSGYERASRTPDNTWHTLNGVPIPPRPAEPDNCCMSGCVHCVWDDYRDEVEDWAVRLKEAQAKARGSGIIRGAPKAHMGRREVEEASGSMDDDGGGSETNWSTELGGSDPDELFASIPVGIREFMRTEKRLRSMHQHEK